MTTDAPLPLIERAFQLATELPSIVQIKQCLKDEGYADITRHLEGRTIRKDLQQIIDQQGGSQ